MKLPNSVLFRNLNRLSWQKPGEAALLNSQQNLQVKRSIAHFLYSFSSFCGKLCENRNIPVNYFYLSKSIFSEAKTAPENAQHYIHDWCASDSFSVKPSTLNNSRLYSWQSSLAFLQVSLAMPVSLRVLFPTQLIRAPFALHDLYTTLCVGLLQPSGLDIITFEWSCTPWTWEYSHGGCSHVGLCVWVCLYLGQRASAASWGLCTSLLQHRDWEAKIKIQ